MPPPCLQLDRVSRHFGGLKAVDSTPVISGNRAWFLSNEGTIECVLLESGQLAPRWPVRLERGALCEPVVGDGRVLIYDRDNQLICFDQIEGRGESRREAFGRRGR